MTKIDSDWIQIEMMIKKQETIIDINSFSQRVITP